MFRSRQGRTTGRSLRSVARRQFAPKGWADLLLQVVLLGSFAIVYALSGIYGRAQAATGVENARTVFRVERTIGIDWEHGVQDWALRGPHLLIDVANRTYFFCQFVVSTIFLLWLYTRRNESFPRVRNALLAANSVAVLVLFAFPMAPPLMVPRAGFVDTLNENAVNLHSPLIDALNNPYSAMPSLHASYAIVLGVAGVAATRRWWSRLCWAAYPGLVTYSVLATGNHFVLDVLAGAAALLATPLVDRAAARISHYRARRRDSLVAGQAQGRPA